MYMYIYLLMQLECFLPEDFEVSCSRTLTGSTMQRNTLDEETYYATIHKHATRAGMERIYAENTHVF